MGKVYLFSVGLFWLGCSASAGRPLCNDPNGCNGKDGGGVVHDMSLSVAVMDMAVSMVTVDLAPGSKMFGDPCGGNSECASGICILSGIGGTCSMLCDNTPCPEGYGCFGVLGAVDPGQVANVCVSTRSQLCTPCQTSPECSATSSDICYTAATGGNFCGRDCTTVSCPTGYNCQDLTVAGNTYKQCIPQSGACDCNAMLLGAKKNCPITTPFGTCNGMLNCQGDTGWSACNPPSLTDVPDDNFTDDNCDGIDGDVTKGVFVATNAVGAVDSVSCGTLALPCKSIGQGLTNSLSLNLPYVYVQAGNYNEELNLKNGKTIVGGYDTGWQRGPYGSPGHTVHINGNGFDAGEGQYITVKAHNVTNAVIMEVEINGVNASSALHPGLSSYAVHAATNAVLQLHNVGINAGNGANGAGGSPGTAASSLSVAAGGQPGGGAYNVSASSCDPSPETNGGGAAGTNSCPDSDNPNGGNGGNGGIADCTSGCVGPCPLCVCGCLEGTCSPGSGSDGNSAAYTAGGVGGKGSGQSANDGDFSCSSPPVGGDAGNGRSPSHGSGGLANGTIGGQLSGGYWSGFVAGTGGLGANGTGGGGGGGGGGAHVLFPPNHESDGGGGGGGGGAGGCRARGGGGGGGPGGGSFGVFATNSTVTVDGTSAIQLGVGGQGGQGGIGGLGQPGGSGNSGGQQDGSGNNCEERGGHGGNGTQGGHSGAGAGGNGGLAFGIFSYTSTVTQTATITVGGGGGGPAGSAGLAAPATGANPGAGGNAGLSGTVGVCHGTSNCCPGNNC